MGINIKNIKEIITLELFEEVMGFKVKGKEISVQEDGIWYDNVSSNNEYRISINDFFFKCKDFALSQDYMLNSFTNFNGKAPNDNPDYIHKNGVARLYLRNDSSAFGKFDCCLESEQEAVFKCCEWLTKNQK